jgi:hypothetical protein
VNGQQAFAVERSQLVFVAQGYILKEAQNRNGTDWHDILRRLIVLSISETECLS